MPVAIKLKDIIENAILRFTEAGIESANVDAELIVGYTLGLTRGQVQAEIIGDAEIAQETADQLTELFARRARREPLQHITGVAYFRNLELVVGPGVFVPRPETEFVTQLAIDALHATPGNSPVAVDLGTGTGAIALSMATEIPNAKIYAVEKSETAIVYTRKNFARYGSDNAVLVQGDLADAFEEINGTVAVVISNPPYIPNAAVPRDPEVNFFDPELALYGGEDGLDVMRLVSKTAQRLLVNGGTLVVEHADSQADAVRQLLLAEGWRQVNSHQDLTARNRAVTAIK